MANPEWENYKPTPPYPKGELFYVACPYSHKDKAVMVERWEKVNKFAAKLMAKGWYIYSPISHTHPIAVVGDLPRGWDFWHGYDTCMISRANGLIVFMIDGWKESTGVQAEIKLAKDYQIPVSYYDENGEWVSTESDYTKEGSGCCGGSCGCST